MAYTGQAVFDGTTDPVTGSWNNATALNSTVVSSDITGYGVVVASFVVTGTVTQGTAIFEVSDDGGTTWWSIAGLQTGNNSQATSTSVTSSVSYEFATGAYNLFRVRLNPAILGSGSVAIRLSAEAFPFTTAIAVAGTVNVSITGTNAVTVSGTVAVTQSGTWTVGISAGQTIAVTNTGTFAVQAAQSGTWNIGTLTTITNPVTVAQPTAANLNATVVGTGTFAVQATQAGTWTVQQGTPPWSVSGFDAPGAASTKNPVQTAGLDSNSKVRANQTDF